MVSEFLIVLTMLLSAAPAFAKNDVMNCPPNQWTITINDADQSSKEDLLSAFDLIGENGGFQVTGIISFPPLPCRGSAPGCMTSRARFTYLSFQPNYYSNQAQATKIRRRVLTGLQEIPGILLYCEPRVEVPGGITGSN